MKNLLPAILLIVLLAACNANSATTSTPYEDDSTGYPVATVADNYDPGYPVEEPTQEIVLTPTSDDSKGNVSAVINYNGQPLGAYVFYLADVLKGEDGKEIATSLDRINSPQAVTDNQGVLTFHNIEPGRYGLIMIEGMNSYLLLNPTDGNSLIIDVAAGERLDLGTLNYTDLPIE